MIATFFSVIRQINPPTFKVSFDTKKSRDNTFSREKLFLNINGCLMLTYDRSKLKIKQITSDLKKWMSKWHCNVLQKVSGDIIGVSFDDMHYAY